MITGCGMAPLHNCNVIDYGCRTDFNFRGGSNDVWAGGLVSSRRRDIQRHIRLCSSAKLEASTADEIAFAREPGRWPAMSKNNNGKLSEREQ